MKNRRGFTIVELLIVVVVIAILAIIAITVFPGIQTRAQNSARSSLANSSVKLLELYRADNGRYPYIPASTGACLGTGYPNSRCRDSNTGGATSYLESTTVLSAVLSPYGVMNGGYVPVLGTGGTLTTGPYVLGWSGGQGFTLYMPMSGEDSSVCPNGFTSSAWNDPTSSLLVCGKDYSSPMP